MSRIPPTRRCTTSLWRAFGTTIQLLIWGIVISAVIAIAVGVYSAVRQYSAGDYVFTGLSYVAIAVPPFIFGLLAMQLLGVMLKNKLGLERAAVPLRGAAGPAQTSAI